jgi:hypothetical protein
MKTSFCFVIVLLSLALFCGGAVAGNGNNLPSGPRYMLNVIAFDNCPAGDFTDSNRHMIAVKANFYADPGAENPLTSTQAGKLVSEMIKTNTIALTPTPPELGNTFQVIDGNACSKGGAAFMLPADPYDCGTGIRNDQNCITQDLTFQEYKVYVRLVGKPKTAIGVTTCATETVLNESGVTQDVIACSTENVVKVRMTGKNRQQFDDVSKELLTICLDTDFDGTCDTRYPLFAAPLSDYFWQWNTDGKAHAQLVFIPVPD